LTEEGRLFDESGSWKRDLRVDTIDVPEGVRLVIGRRLDRLGEHARKGLTAAAVIGRVFPLDVLQAILETSEDAVLDAIDEAERAHIIAAEQGVREARYGFVHELIRTTLVSGLSLPRRQRLHVKIADAIERLRAASLENHTSALRIISIKPEPAPMCSARQRFSCVPAARQCQQAPSRSCSSSAIR